MICFKDFPRAEDAAEKLMLYVFASASKSKTRDTVFFFCINMCLIFCHLLTRA